MSTRAFELLVVDDDPYDVLAIKAMIETMPDAGVWPQIRVHSAASLSDAIGWLATNYVDCVLLDVGLPDSGGLQTVAAVHSEYPDVPIVVHSAQDELSFAVDAIRAGAQDVLPKGQCGPDTVLRAAILSTWRSASQPAQSAGTMVDDVAVAACRVDADLRILQYNTAFAALAPEAQVSQVVTDQLERDAILDMAGAVHRVTSRSELSETLDTTLATGEDVCLQVIATQEAEATVLFHVVPSADDFNLTDPRMMGYQPEPDLRR